MFPINFNFPYRKKDGSLITMEKALDGAGADLDLIDLDDVAITTPSDGDVLVYDGTSEKWKNTDLGLTDLDDVAITTPADGNVLVYDGTSEKWENAIITPVDISSQVTAQASEIGSFKVYKLGKIVIVSAITSTGIEIGTEAWVRRSLLTGLPYTSTPNSIGLMFQTMSQKIPCAVEMSGGELRCVKEYGVTSAIDYSQAYFRINFVYVCD